MGINRETLKQLGHVFRPLATKIANMVARSVVQLVDDKRKLQLVQIGVLVGETVEGGAGGAEHFQPYGFTSVPLVGAEGVAVFPNGDRSHPLVIAVSDRRYRPTGGTAGEVSLYTDEGDIIKLGRGHVISLSTSGTLRLGSTAASDGAIKGTTRNTAEQTFLTAMATFVAAVVPTTGAPAAAITAFGAAITAFKTAAGAAVSTKVKLE